MDSAARDELAGVLTAPGQPLDARQAAAVALAAAGDRRAFETLALLLNYREPARAESAASALAQLGDPRTARAAAALATNPLRVAYAVPPIRLLVRLRAPESVPALIETLDRLLAERTLAWEAVPACVQGLGELGDPRAAPVLRAARAHPRLREAATAALERIGCYEPDAPGPSDAPGSSSPSGDVPLT
ncbi:adenylosuccinate lyase [Streptomyces sp. NPDC006733]|uniref:HEAT repeat domain-containing protein n=1 Tax=Streptomyces sp. NPDC006733 TaxID=3155460 RepID=UPI0034077BD2